MAVFNVGPAHVRGVIKGRWSRVVWSDGTLYVLVPNGGSFTRHTLETSAPVRPSTSNGYWRAEGESGSVSFTQRGCGTCGPNPYKLAGLAGITIENIING